MIIRSPRPEDNEELIELDRISPEVGLVSYYVDRRPTYIRRPEAEGFFPFVAEDDGKVVGVVFSSVERLYVNGDVRKCDYISSLRVHPDYRKRGVGSALVRRAIQKGKEDGAGIFWAVVIGKNLASFKTFQKCGFSKVGGLGLKILRMKRRRRSSESLLREATEDDLQQMVDILSSFYSRHNLRPEVTEEWVTRRLRRKRSTSRFYVAEKDGIVVATVRAVKQWHTTKMIITKLPAKAKIGSFLLGLGIKEGSVLKMLDLTDLAYARGEERSANNLISFAQWRHADECRISFLQYALGGSEERFMGALTGVLGYSDVMAMSPDLPLGKLDPVFPSR
ncbi:MAG: GNAT family N-acetyltransferase [Thermoplasmata archaeon]